MGLRFPGQRPAYLFLGAASVCLITGATIGVLASIPHGWPGLIQDVLPFQKLRPLHVTLSIGWIFLAYMGALVHFVPVVCSADWWSARLIRIQLALLGVAGAAAVASYVAGRVSGREYFDFVPAIGGVIALAWALFLLNFFKTIVRRGRPWPVYLWMWATGLVFFAVTFIEGHLYLIPWFGDAFPRDLTVQWKSYGGLIGSWNLVVYGLSIYVAEAIAGDPAVGRSRVAFAFYWLATANLILGFAHHTYAIPQSLIVRKISFVTSMTEWVILGSLLWTWTKPDGGAHDIPRRFLRSATFWIGVNLALALLISIPALYNVTHGTHVTVAHAMGSTIGINTMILMAAGFLILLQKSRAGTGTLRLLRWGLTLTNAALLAFFACLLIAGSVKGQGMVRFGWSHFAAMDEARPYLRGMVVCGFALWTGLVLLHGRWMALLFGREEPAVIPVPVPRASIPAAAYALVVFGVASIPWWWPVHDEAPSTPVEFGRTLYRREACARCHGVEALDLETQISFRSDGWFRAKLFDPRGSKAESVMPDYAQLTDAESSALAAYLGSLRDRRRVVMDHDRLEGAPPRPAEPYSHAPCLYLTRCAACHGEGGRGDGPAAHFFAGESMPRDFTRGLFRSRSTETLPTDEDLFRTITRGMPGSAMPAFDDLSAAERWALVDVVKSFARRGPRGDGGFNPFETIDRAPRAIPTAPPATPQLVDRGRDVAISQKCAACHGQDWKGLRRDAGPFDWTDEAGRPIWRSTDLPRGLFKGGNAPRDLYRTLFCGQGGSPMPSFGDSLPNEIDRWALVHFIRSLHETPRR